jgi:hypothetical protein
MYSDYEQKSNGGRQAAITHSRHSQEEINKNHQKLSSFLKELDQNMPNMKETRLNYVDHTINKQDLSFSRRRE